MKTTRTTERTPKTRLRCLLCGSEATLNVIYNPGPRQLARGLYLYGLCDACFARADHAEEAELRIEATIIAAN